MLCSGEEDKEYRYSAVGSMPNGKRKNATPANWRKSIACEKQAAAEETI